jgi:chromosome segregation ATPase
LKSREKELREQTAALELSQQGRHADREKLSQMDSELRALKDSLKKKDADHERFKDNTRKATDRLHEELAESKAQTEVKTEEIEVLTSHYGNALSDLDLARDETARVESEHEDLKTEYALLKKELQVC